LVEILDNYRYQPWLEKRHEQLKTGHKVAPVLLLIQALIEREVRLEMKNDGLECHLKHIPGMNNKGRNKFRV
jgi:hypothetical protein